MADDRKPLVWEDRARLREAIDAVVDAEIDGEQDEKGAELELQASIEFGQLVAGFKELCRTTVAVLLSPDATEEHKERARAEFVEVASEASAEIKRRLEALECNLDRCLSMH